MHKIRHSGTEKADANFDFEGRPQWHIQMSTGKHKELVNPTGRLSPDTSVVRRPEHAGPRTSHSVASRRRWKTLEPILHQYIRLYIKLYQVYIRSRKDPKCRLKASVQQESQGLLGKLVRLTFIRLYHTCVVHISFRNITTPRTFRNLLER